MDYTIIYIFVGFSSMLALYMYFNYKKNQLYNSNVENNGNIDDDLDTDEEYTVELNEIRENREITDKIIDPATGLNKHGCNCICHQGKPIYHLVPCCGIVKVCGCPCHQGIDYIHNIKCRKKSNEIF